MTAIVSIKHPDPQFESQTKVKLNESEVQTYVQQVVGEVFSTFLEENPAAAKAIISKMSYICPCPATRRVKPATMVIPKICP